MTRGQLLQPRVLTAVVGIGFLLTGSARSGQGPKAPPRGTSILSTEYWRSVTTGNEYRVRIQNDTFYAEWVNIPPDFARHGAYVRTECRRVGAMWVGTTRSYLPCTEGSGPKAPVLNWCPLVTRIEIDSIAPDRITGRGQTIRRPDCKTCKLLETGWSDFVWVPRTSKR